MMQLVLSTFVFGSLTSVRWALAVCTLIVAIGLIIEYSRPLSNIVKVGWKIATFRSTGFDRCVFRKLIFHSIGAILVTGGVAGELVFESRSFVKEYQATAASDKQIEQLALANKHLDIDLAGAKLDLSTKETAMSKDLEAEKQKTARFQEQADLARSAFNKQLVLLGPRLNLLYGKNRQLLIERLKPFAGQSAEIRFCEISLNRYSVDGDVIGVAQFLAEIKYRAGWIGDRFSIEKPGCNGQGITVSVDPKASSLTKKAARAFINAVSKVPLIISPYVFEIPPTDAREQTDINTVIVTVLSHP